MNDYDKWIELKETIQELNTNGGMATQEEITRFLLNLMNELERQEKEAGND